MLPRLADAAAQKQQTTEEEEEEGGAKIKVGELDTVGLNLQAPRSKSRSRLVTHAATHLDFVAVCHGIYCISDALHHKCCPLHSVVVLEVVNDVRGQSSACVCPSL